MRTHVFNCLPAYGRAIVELCAANLTSVSFLFHTSGHDMISQLRTTYTLSPQLGNGVEQKRARGSTSLKVIMASYPARGQKTGHQDKSHSHSLEGFKTLHAVYWTSAKIYLPSFHRVCKAWSELWEKGSIVDWMSTARSNIRGRDRAEPKSPLRRFLSIEAQDIRPNIYKCTKYTLNRAEPLNEISGNTSCTEHLMGRSHAVGFI